MAQVRTVDQLIQELDGDLAWRLREIAAIRSSIRSASGTNQNALLRAAVPIMYAHWEGFIKCTAIKYGSFLSNRNIKFSEARYNLAGLKALGYVKQMHPITRRIYVASELLVSLHRIDDEIVSIAMEDSFSNVGNLGYELFEQLVSFLAIDPTAYSSKRPLIDESLLKSRNNIAHGEYLMIDRDGFESMSDEVLAIMRQFKNDVENAAVLKAYLRPV